MADLTWTEKRNLERLFQMRSGYVLDFSNRTFDEFVTDSTGRSIYDDKYALEGTSKANRLRSFWTAEGNHLVAKLLGALVDHAAGLDDSEPKLIECCRKIVARLEQDAPVSDLDALVKVGTEHDFETVANAVRGYIEKNDPVAGLDRLHTFVTTYLRKLCDGRGIVADRGKPLHSMFGEYVKSLRAAGEIETEMTERILKSSISVLEAFNHVRNDRSLAHDNVLLGYDEALLIFNHIAALVRFLRELERRNRSRKTAQPEDAPLDDDIPF